MMSTPVLRMSTLAPVRRTVGDFSTMVMLMLRVALRSQKAKTLPAMPEPEIRTLKGSDTAEGWSVSEMKARMDAYM